MPHELFVDVVLAVAYKDHLDVEMERERQAQINFPPTVSSTFAAFARSCPDHGSRVTTARSG